MVLRAGFFIEMVNSTFIGESLVLTDLASLPYDFDTLSVTLLLLSLLPSSTNLTRFGLMVNVAEGVVEPVDEDISDSDGNASDLNDCERERKVLEVSGRESFRADASHQIEREQLHFDSKSTKGIQCKSIRRDTG